MVSGVCVLICVLIVAAIYGYEFMGGYGDENQNNIADLSDVNITISMKKSEFSTNDKVINITVNITNNGDEVINMSGFCYSFVVVFPDGSQREVFCNFNNTRGLIGTNESFEQTVNLLEYSYVDTSQKIDLTSAGKYSIYAIYNSKNNPWGGFFPYEEASSNTLCFRIIEV